MITKKITTMLAVTALAIAGQLSAAETAAEKSNVMFIFADDQTYESIGAYGQLNIKTPNLDRLVKRGVSFTHSYNMGAWGGAVCVASRAMLNSGRFVNRAEKGVKQYPHWSQIMNGAGYTTYMTGKWHVHGNPRFDVLKDVRGGMPNQTQAPVEERVKRLRAYRWSSYRAYAGLETGQKWMDYEPLRELVAVNAPDPAASFAIAEFNQAMARDGRLKRSFYKAERRLTKH